MSNPNSAWRSPWVVGIVSMLLAFVAISGYRIYLAYATDPGLVNADYYEQGQNYENSMNARRIKAAEYEMSIEVPNRIRLGEPATIRFTGVDVSGVPLHGDSATAFVYRPADKSQDFSVPMEAEGNGRYVAQVTFPLKGAWDLVVSLKQGDEEVNAPRRIMVRDAQ